MSEQDTRVLSLTRNIERSFDAAKKEQLQRARTCQEAGSRVEIRLAGPVNRPL